MIKFIEEINPQAFENRLGYIFNLQSKVDQPVYLITGIRDNKFTAIECFTTEGEIDLEKLKSVYKERYYKNSPTKNYEIIELNLKDVYNPLE